jgi:hypothetical protein
VRVRYVRLWSRYGRSPGRLALSAFVTAACGVLLVAFRAKPRQWLARLDPAWAPADVFDIAEPIVLAVGGVMALFALYRLVRALTDMAATRSFTGQVLAIRDWRSGDPKNPPLSQLAVDDGTADHTLAWVLPTRRVAELRHGDIVRMTAYPWTRTVRGLDVVRNAPQPADEGTRVDIDKVMATHAGDRVASRARRAEGQLATIAGWIAGEVSGPESAMGLLTPGEVSQVVGLDVTASYSSKRMVTFYTAKPVRTALTILAVRKADRVLRKLYTRGTRLPGIGDEAYLHRGLGMVRVGSAMAVLNVYSTGANTTAEAAPPQLLSTVASRLNSEP